MAAFQETLVILFIATNLYNTNMHNIFNTYDVYCSFKWAEFVNNNDYILILIDDKKAPKQKTNGLNEKKLMQILMAEFKLNVN